MSCTLFGGICPLFGGICQMTRIIQIDFQGKKIIFNYVDTDLRGQIYSYL